MTGRTPIDAENSVFHAPRWLAVECQWLLYQRRIFSERRVHFTVGAGLFLYMSIALASVLPLQAATSECSRDAVTLSSEVFLDGSWTVASEQLVTTAGAVEVQPKADVVFVAPQIQLGAGFRVVQGARFAANVATVTCPETNVISHAEVQTGASAESFDVKTSSEAQLSNGGLYLAAISSKPWRNVVEVSGLGLSWFLVGSQCSGRSATGVTVWAAVGPAKAGEVTASFLRAPENAVISVSRFTGVDAADPIGAVQSINTTGLPSACDGGTDSPSYSFDFATSDYGSLVVSVAAMRNLTHTPGSGWIERVETAYGSDGEIASLAVQDAIVANPGSVAVSGAFSGPVDWAVIALELRLSSFVQPAPSFVVTPGFLDFGRMLVDTHRSMAFEVSNDGAADLSVTSLQLVGEDARLFSINADAYPLRLPPRGSTEVNVLFTPVDEGTVSAALEIDSNDVNLPRVSLPLTASCAFEVDGIWTSAEELASRPTDGSAWEALKAAADGELGFPDLGDWTTDHDTRTLAVGLVYARTGQTDYRQKARDAIESAIGTESSTTEVVQLCRNLASYVFAADLIDLATFDPTLDAQFRDWIDSIRYVNWPDGTIVGKDEERAANHGRMCGMSRAAIAVYLGDQAELSRSAKVLAGFLGDTWQYDSFLWTNDLSWQADETTPLGVNPAGATKGGLSIDGALPEEMRRGGPFQVPPLPTGYPWEALQGTLVEAVILARAGYSVFDWSDRAILRIVEFLERLDVDFPGDGWWAHGDDTWIPWVINHFYGTGFPTMPANIGKCMAWTDWTHAP